MKAALLPNVTADEAARRVAHYRQMGLAGKAPAQIVYQGTQAVCPWPECGFHIDGIHFRLEDWVPLAELAAHYASWWQGPGLVGRCPNCRQLVQFSLEGMKKVARYSAAEGMLLPDDWAVRAKVVSRSPNSR